MAEPFSLGYRYVILAIKIEDVEVTLTGVPDHNMEA